MNKKFTAISIVLSFLAAAACAAADESAWAVKQTQTRVEFDSGSLFLDFEESCAWTMRNMKYKGRNIIIPAGWNGTVLQAKGKWFGTGHGGEQVKSLDILLNGVDIVEFDGASPVREARMIKESNIGPLDLRVEIVFPESGDRIVEKHTYTVVEELPGKFNFLYAFMHMNDNAFNQWLAILEAGEEVEGVAGKGDNKFSLGRDIKGLIFYNEAAETGVAYVYPEVYAGADSFKNSIWDRARDNKFYFRPEVLAKGYKPGDKFAFTIKVIPFQARPGDWRAKGRDLAMQPGF